MSQAGSRSQIVQNLRQAVARIERSAGVERNGRAAASTGLVPLDRFLPDGGWRRGGLVELLTEDGGGAETLVFSTLSRLVSSGRALLVLDALGTFYPPAAQRLGVDPARTIVLRPPRPDDTLWAMEQALRCPGVAAVVAWAGVLNNVVFRRLQLAAEAGVGTGFLFRSDRFRAQPSWADVRLAVRPVPSVRAASRPLSAPFYATPPSGTPSSGAPPSRAVSSFSGRLIQVELVHFRGGAPGDVLHLEIDEQTAGVRVASGLADPAPAARKAGA